MKKVFLGFVCMMMLLCVKAQNIEQDSLPTTKEEYLRLADSQLVGFKNDIVNLCKERVDSNGVGHYDYESMGKIVDAVEGFEYAKTFRNEILKKKFDTMSSVSLDEEMIVLKTYFGPRKIQNIFKGRDDDGSISQCLMLITGAKECVVEENMDTWNFISMIFFGIIFLLLILEIYKFLFKA